MIKNNEFAFSYNYLTKLNEYFDENQDSLVPRFIGVYSLPEINFVVMKNILNSNVGHNFDLKEIISQNNEDSSSVKHQSVYNMWVPHKGIWKYNVNDPSYFLEILKKDCKFLQKFNLIDYSLIVISSKEAYRRFRAFNNLGKMIEWNYNISCDFNVELGNVFFEHDFSRKFRRILNFLCCISDDSYMNPFEYQENFIESAKKGCFGDEKTENS